MCEAIGILFGNSRIDGLQGLAEKRPIEALPFGRYRLLDFALSSMVNSGIRTIGLITPYHNRTMLSHIGAGKAWFLERKAGGLFILPETIYGLVGRKEQFFLKDLALNIEYLQRDQAENVVISSCNQVFNINYREVLDYHEDKNADITLVYKKFDTPNRKNSQTHLIMDEKQRVINFNDYDELENSPLNFINMLIIRRQILLDIINEYQEQEGFDLLDAITIKLKSLKIYGYSFQGYIGIIQSVQDYYQCSMDILDTKIREKLFLGLDRIHTKLLDNPPTCHGEHAKVRNSLIASGCMIEGKVENSVISRGVIIEPEAQVINCIIMSKCWIRAQTILNHVILDKLVEVGEGRVLQGNSENPMVVLKRAKI